MNTIKMKTVAIIGVIMVVMFTFAGLISIPATVANSPQSEFAEMKESRLIELRYNDTSNQLLENEPALNVSLKVWELLPWLNLRWYLIKVTVKNLDNKEVNLGVGRPAGGFIIYNESGKEIYRKPEYTIAVLNSLSLKPHQKKTLYLGIWNMRRCQEAKKYVIYGVMYSYEYKGEIYPPIKSEPIVIFPPSRAMYIGFCYPFLWHALEILYCT